MLRLKKIICIIFVVVLAFCISCTRNIQTDATLNKTKSKVDRETSNNVKKLDKGMVNRIVAIAAGDKHTVALEEDGTVWTWGNNEHGQLGIGTKESSNIPTKVKDLTNIIAIAAGSNHTLALEKDGTVWSWGAKESSSFDYDSKKDRIIPVKEMELKDIVAIDANAFNSLALRKDGTVWAWGDNIYKQLGSNRDNSEIPEQVPELNNAIKVASGGSYNITIKEDSTVWVWGEGYIEVNLCTEGDYYDGALTKVKKIENVVDVCGSPGGVIALKKDGTVWEWGDIDSPQKIIQLTDIIAIGQGLTHNMAVERDGVVWTWGDNERGQIGNGTSKDADYKPSQIQGLRDIIRVVGGEEYSVAFDKDGAVWTWGANDKGQLGDGTNVDKLKPIKIIFN